METHIKLYLKTEKLLSEAIRLSDEQAGYVLIIMAHLFVLEHDYDMAIKTLHRAESALSEHEVFIRNCLYLRAIIYGMSRESAENHMNGKIQRLCVRRDIKSFLKHRNSSKTRRKNARRLLLSTYLPLWMLRGTSQEIYSY